METKNYFFNNNNNKIPFNNDSTNQNFISDKKINSNNQELNLFYSPSLKRKGKESPLEGESGNDKKIENLLTKEIINKITLVSNISQQNLLKKRELMENLIEEKEESFEEKYDENLFSDYEKNEESEDNYIEDLNDKNKVQNIENQNIKEIVKKSVNFKLEKDKEKNNDYEEVKENNKNANNHKRKFSYNTNIINNNEDTSNGSISSFFYLTSKHLKEELEHDLPFYSDFHHSQNYIPKFTFELNCNKNNDNSDDQRNNIGNNFENMQTENMKININSNIFFLVYNQMNIYKNNNYKNNENMDNMENSNGNKSSIINSHDEILNNKKNESIISINEKTEKEGKIKFDKETIINIQSFVPKNRYKNINEKQNNQTQEIFYNKFSNSSNNLNFKIYNQGNKNYLFNNSQNNNKNNRSNSYNQNCEDIQQCHKISNNSNKQILSNINKDTNKSNTNTSKTNLLIPLKYDKDLVQNINNLNEQKISFQDDNNELKSNISKNSNNMIDISANINLFNINYLNNYINLINQKNNNQNLKKDEPIIIEQYDIKTQLNNILNNEQINNLNPDDYIIQMFNRYGWICRLCNNFNFVTRTKCNRCQEIKTPKMKNEIFNQKDKRKNNKKKQRKLDWLCLNCRNINYGFRKICNKCKIEKKEYFPSLYYDPNTKINNSNIKIILMKNFGKTPINLNNNEINVNVNNFINNNINQNNYINKTNNTIYNNSTCIDDNISKNINT